MGSAHHYSKRCPCQRYPWRCVRVVNRDICLDFYNNLKLGARPASGQGFTSQMATLNLRKFSGETRKDVYGWLTAVIPLFCVSQTLTEFCVNAASSSFTGAANTWFIAWTTETVGELNWSAFRRALKKAVPGPQFFYDPRLSVPLCSTERHGPRTSPKMA